MAPILVAECCRQFYTSMQGEVVLSCVFGRAQVLGGGRGTLSSLFELSDPAGYLFTSQVTSGSLLEPVAS